MKDKNIPLQCVSLTTSEVYRRLWISRIARKADRQGRVGDNASCLEDDRQELVFRGDQLAEKAPRLRPGWEPYVPRKLPLHAVRKPHIRK